MFLAQLSSGAFLMSKTPAFILIPPTCILISKSYLRGPVRSLSRQGGIIILLFGKFFGLPLKRTKILFSTLNYRQLYNIGIYSFIAFLALQHSLGWQGPLEKEMITHSIILAWRIPWTEEPGGLQSHGVVKSWTQLNE